MQLGRVIILATITFTVVSYGHKLVSTGAIQFTHRKDPKDKQNPWYAEANGGKLPSIWTTAVDGSDASFPSTLQRWNVDFVLVEFFSRYCPHCQAFAPELERVAEMMHNQSLPIFIGTVDCVDFMDTCKKYLKPAGGGQLPGLLWGSQQDWLSGSISSLDLVELDYDTAESLVDTIAPRIDADLSLPSRADFLTVWKERVKEESKGQMSGNLLDVCQIDRFPESDTKLAVALFVRQALEKKDKKEKESTALLNFVDLLADMFPHSDKKCGTSMRELHTLLIDNSSLDADTAEASWKLCDEDWDTYRKGWYLCQPSFPGARGYTCGLWSLFHSLAAKADDSSALRTMSIVREAIRYFFDCTDCHDHFFNIDFSDADAATQADAQLWWWRAHNAVNQRVGEQENESEEGDPLYPKIQFPPECICPKCRKSSSLYDVSTNTSLFLQVAPHHLRSRRLQGEQKQNSDWDTEAVLEFLAQFYG